jgi:uncharacterized protein (DUF2164 family)
MDVKRYRKRYEAELAKAGEPKDIGLAADKDALAERVNGLLATVRDRDERVDARVRALQELSALDFLGPRFGPFRADYKQALRDVATDRQRRLREKALELLAIEKDSYAQELLVRGLKEPKEALVPEARAIQFLGYDDHAEIAPLAREVFKRSKGVAREEALRALATDPKSERLFARLLKDKSEKASIRAISASGLQSLNPAAFERTARRIVADDSDYDAIRATSLAALAHGREARETPMDPKLVDTVQKLAAQTRSPAMRSSIRRFLQSAQE